MAGSFAAVRGTGGSPPALWSPNSPTPPERDLIKSIEQSYRFNLPRYDDENYDDETAPTAIAEPTNDT
jgi:hypothetical protein